LRARKKDSGVLYETGHLRAHACEGKEGKKGGRTVDRKNKKGVKRGKRWTEASSSDLKKKNPSEEDRGKPVHKKKEKKKEVRQKNRFANVAGGKKKKGT